MRPVAAASEDPLLAVYDRALPVVYGYLVSRCNDTALAEDLTSETFMAALERPPEEPSTPWLLGVARHKLMDHWRAKAREERGLHVMAAESRPAEDPWEVELESVVAATVLAQLAPQHRAALTFRYVDDLPVPEVAALLDRTVRATEALLMRAKAAFRRAYSPQEGQHA